MYLTHKHILFFIPLVLGFYAAGAQNLVANPSFEDVNICTEFAAPCSPAAWESVAPESSKLDYMFHQYPSAAGNNLLRLVYYSRNGLHNYAQTQLLCPLEKGRTYRVTIVGWRDSGLAPDIELRFDTAWMFRESGGILSELRPTVQLGAPSVVKTSNKVFILQKEFTAADHYGYLILGTLLQKDGLPANVHNYIDSIAVAPVAGDNGLCASAAKTKDSLYNQHRRHSIPARFFREQESLRQQRREQNLKCVTLQVKDHTVFTAAGRAKDPVAASRLDSIIRAYDPALGMKVRIAGHAFREGSFNYNKVVAETSAKKIMEVLIYMKGLSYDDITVDSRGNTQPRYDTTTTEGRERNNFSELEFCMPGPAEDAIIPETAAPQQPDTLVVPDILFRTGSSELNEHFFSELDSLLKKIPAGQPVQLQIIGHTDNRGEDEYNQELSHRRALTVAGYLKLKGWGNYIRHVSGQGEKRPLASNDTGEGRQRNRRVEIIVYRSAE